MNKQALDKKNKPLVAKRASSRNSKKTLFLK